MKKVLLINGSPHVSGNTFMALTEVARMLEENGVATEMVHIGVQPVRGCIGCQKCKTLGRCVFTDELYETVRTKLMECDALVVGSPVYYASANGSLCALLDRIFYTCGDIVAYKPAAAVAVCRRSGASTTLDRLSKYFTISNMPVVASQYWAGLHGREAGEVREDAEGMQTLRMLGRNMAALLNAGVSPEIAPKTQEKRIMTNFIR